nr:DUF4292 domain-containing protein [uncultured Flavobacterium sp.]
MKKIVVMIMAAGALFTSCKSKQAAGQQGTTVDVSTEVAADTDKATKEIVAGHYANPYDFSTLLIKADARYEDKNQRQGVSAEVRMKKDETILVSVRYLGFTVAKALITPSEVSYYEKIGGTYFKGDYKLLSRWLGTELDFKKVQNLLLGEALYDLKAGGYKSAVEDGKYKITGKQAGILKEFLFEGSKYLLAKQRVEQQGTEPRSLDIQYPGHTEYPKAILPSGINILAEQADKVKIDIKYNSVTFDEKLTFPFEIPENSTEITLD